MEAARHLVGWALVTGLLALALGAWALRPGGETVRRGVWIKGSLAGMAAYWLLMAALLAALIRGGGGG